jgi:4-carboxymuconolactone decarboxylase
MSRLTQLDPAEMTPEQKRVYDEIRSGPRGGARGPFNAWLRVPPLADHAQKLGAFCRFGTSLGPKLSELAIIITARHFKAEFEWYAHERLAREAGLPPAIIAAVLANRRPDFEDERQAAVHDFCAALFARNRVDEATYKRAIAALGEAGVVEVVGTIGYYSLVSLTLNAFEVPLPDGVKAAFSDQP